MSDTPESDKNSIEWDRANEAGCSLVFAQGLERERDQLRERVDLLESWIATAAPVLESACCIVIKDDVCRFHEIADCRGIIESCPVEFQSTKAKEAK
jgi:hypothetical protein